MHKMVGQILWTKYKYITFKYDISNTDTVRK